jgi:hypothetical protein
MPYIHLHRFEHHETPFPLGRHIERDSRSRHFEFKVAPKAGGGPQTSVIWTRNAPTLNQGNIGSCTGNAMAQMLNCAIFAPCRKAVRGNDGWLNEKDALGLYSLATHLDGFGSDQYYPPNDEGSSGLGVAKAAQQDGYVDTYAHCYTLPQVQAALAVQPVIAGVSWTNSMFSPDSVTGILPVGPINDETIAGGHEFLLQGIDYQLQCIVMTNSWGDNWYKTPAGLTPGQARIKFSDFANLLAADGDVVVPHGKGLN